MEASISIGSCVRKTIKEARRLRSKFADAIDVKLQFPCVLRKNGSIGVHRGFMGGLQSASEQFGTTMIPDTDELPTVDDLFRRLTLTVKSDVKAKESSHGEIRFGTVDDVSVVVKLMPIAGMPNRVSNSAYVDPFLSWLGSQLVDKQQSVGFIQLYGTFLCREKDEPLVAMVSERMFDNLDKLLDSYILKEGIRWKKLIGVVLQVMLALAHAHALTMVHNDTHMGNFLTKPTCGENTSLYMSVKGRVLKVPVDVRVVLMDFGRSTISNIICDKNDRCRSRRGGRLKASEVVDKFPDWEMDTPGSDVVHFAAMLMMSQVRANMFAEEASKPDAPVAAKALLRLLRQTLQCGTGRDMFEEYDACNAAEMANPSNTCSKKLVHELRYKSTGCTGISPLDWLSDRELTAPFEVMEPIPPLETVYRPDIALV